MAPRLVARPGAARETVLSGRADALSDAALVALIAAEGSEDVGHAVLDAYPRPDGLWRVCAEDLVRMRGIGPAGAARLLACLELSRRASAWPAAARPVVSTPEDVVRLCGTQLRGLDREHFWALILSTKNQLLRMSEVSVGSLNASIVHPRELFKEAVRVSAASIVVVHNHPSGDPTPSGADLQLTRRLARAGEVLGIELLDHVVIGDGGAHASLRDMGVL
ncbi:MAG: DNA repair protein RadC [Coriobacteriia bacterium]|nr:DNA repair protein RadC [Coriobacteriia bacterium]